jgi:simple sugar transport system permease protein
VLYQAAPLVMTGLSVAFAFKTGLFNIGATGQYSVGAAFALIGAIEFQLPCYVCLLAGNDRRRDLGYLPRAVQGAVNVHEVITSSCSTGSACSPSSDHRQLRPDAC